MRGDRTEDLGSQASCGELHWVESRRPVLGSLVFGQLGGGASLQNGAPLGQCAG